MLTRGLCFAVAPVAAAVVIDDNDDDDADDGIAAPDDGVAVDESKSNCCTCNMSTYSSRPVVLFAFKRPDMREGEVDS